MAPRRQIQGLGSLSRGRAGICQMVGVTVNICLRMFKQFWKLYILLNVMGAGKMYNLEKCSTIPRRMLTVTSEIFSLFSHVVLDFFIVLVYTCPVSCEKGTNWMQGASDLFNLIPNLLSYHE